MFSQQSPPHFGQQASTSMYNNNMNINVSMATNTSGMNNMNQMTGQISMTSATSVPTSGLSSMGPEQVNDPAMRGGGNLFPNQLPGMDMIKQDGDAARKYCWPWGWFGCSFLQLTGLRAPNPYQFEELRLFVVSQRSCQPRRLPAADRTQPCLPEGSRVVVAEEQPLLWQSEASVQTLLSLFTAFTLVQLRSLLQSKCWQAIFINHVRLNVFKCMYLRKNNHALVLFLFSSRPWGFFLLCFPWLTQSGAKDSVLSENWCFRLRPAFWGGEEAWRRA